MVPYKWILMHFANYEKIMRQMPGCLCRCWTPWGSIKTLHFIHP